MNVEPPGLGDVQRRALRSSMWSVANAATSFPLLLAATLVLARQLGVSGFGRYSLYAFLIPTVGAAVDLGLTSSFLQRGAAAFGQADGESLRRVAGEALTWALVRFPFVATIAALILRDRAAIAVYVLVAIANAAVSGVVVTMISTIRLGELARLQMLGNVASTSAMIGAASAGLTPAEIYAIATASQSGVYVTQVLYLRDEPALLRACFRPRKLVDLRGDLSFGFTNFAAVQLAGLTLSRSELLFFSSRQVVARGSYAAAYTVGARLTLPIDALYGALSPSLAAIRADDAAFRRGAERALRLSGGLFSLVSGPALVAAVLGAAVIFPASFAGAPAAAAALSAGSLLVSSANPLLSIQLARRRARPLLQAATLALAANVVLCFALIRAFGLAGAVVANTAASVLYVVALGAPFGREAHLASVVRRYALIVVLPLAGAVAGAFALALLDDLFLRTILSVFFGVIYPLVVSRALPSDTAVEIDHVLRQAPAPVARLLGRPARILFARQLSMPQ